MSCIVNCICIAELFINGDEDSSALSIAALVIANDERICKQAKAQVVFA